MHALGLLVPLHSLNTETAMRRNTWKDSKTIKLANGSLNLVESAEVAVVLGGLHVALAEAAGGKLQGEQVERLRLAQQRLLRSLALHAVQSEFIIFLVTSST